MLHAISGLASYQASFSGAPVDAVYPYLTYVQGAWAATCTVSALIARQRWGSGQTVVVDGLHAANVFGGGAYARPVGEPDPNRAVGPGGLNPMYTRYQGSDGRWFYIGGLGPKFGALVIKLTGADHLLEDSRVGGELERLWHMDNSQWVIDYFERLYATRPADHWIDLFESAGVPVTPLFERAEWFGGEQVVVSGQRVEVIDPVLGPVVMPGAPVTSELTPARVAPASAAIPVGELRWLGPSTVSRGSGKVSPPMSGGPLAGIRMASFGSYVAGPYAACLLAELGIDVIKVEPLQGDPWRLQGFSGNRGTRSLSVDLRRPEGVDAVRAVLGGCDVVLNNFRLGVMDRLGIGHDQLAALNPEVLTVAVTAYGEKGPLAGKPGYDTVLQAASGMMLAQGGDDVPVTYSLPPNDYTAAVLGAFATVVALLHRDRTGQAQHVSTSLAAAATVLQGPDLADYPERSPGRFGGRDFPGPTATDRIYRVTDGFVRIQTDEVDSAAWRDAGLDVTAAELAADAATEISRVLLPLTVAEALRRLTAAHVAAVPARRFSEVIHDPLLHEQGVLGWETVRSGARFAAVSRLASFSGTPQTNQLKAPGLGEHSHELLAAAGYEKAHIDELVAEGTVRTGGPLDVVFLPPYR
ncbi:hypothetical protein BCD48_43720 [Pseudofrankia sp. BMG5.36]|nr:hypothetical protein BCD48_43720 [Pseudofrankia sp. BMG5.36]